MFAISLTDLDWFRFLRLRPNLAEVNFWTPTPWNLKRLKRGDHYYFMLKEPYRKIGGFGTFSQYVNMKASEAWTRFGVANGVGSLAELIAKTTGYSAKRSMYPASSTDPIIGCVVLTGPQFYSDSDFIDPNSIGIPMSPNIMKLKYVEGNTLGDYVSDVDYVVAAVTETTTGRRGQGFNPSEEARRAIERCAMQMATVYFRSQGWPDVLDVSATQPYDLLCRDGARELRVEVKGTTTDGNEILLTPNEESHARQHFPDVALYVYANIRLRERSGRLVGVGGRPRIYHPWDIRLGQLRPTSYVYRPPSPGA